MSVIPAAANENEEESGSGDDAHSKVFAQLGEASHDEQALRR
jgi:hypothetical protein